VAFCCKLTAAVLLHRISQILLEILHSCEFDTLLLMVSLNEYKLKHKSFEIEICHSFGLIRAMWPPEI